MIIIWLYIYPVASLQSKRLTLAKDYCPPAPYLPDSYLWFQSIPTPPLSQTFCVSPPNMEKLPRSATWNKSFFHDPSKLKLLSWEFGMMFYGSCLSGIYYSEDRRWCRRLSPGAWRSISGSVFTRKAIQEICVFHFTRSIGISSEPDQWGTLNKTLVMPPAQNAFN